MSAIAREHGRLSRSRVGVFDERPLEKSAREPMSGLMAMSPSELGRLVFGRGFDGPSPTLVVRRANGRIAAASASMASMVGYESDALVGRFAYEILGDSVDVSSPPPEPIAIELGGAVAVSLSIVHIDDPRAGALAACRMRRLDDVERRQAELERRCVALEASCASLSERERAASQRGGVELAPLAASIVEVATAAAHRRTCADVVGGLSQTVAALESTTRVLSSRVSSCNRRVRAALTPACERSRRAVARMEAPLLELLRAGRRELELAPEWVDLVREVGMAARLAEVRGSAAIACDGKRGAFAFLPRAAFHHVVSLAVAATAAATISVEARGRTWQIAVRGPGRAGGDELVLAASLAHSWGGDVTIESGEDGRVVEIAAPIMIEA